MSTKYMLDVDSEVMFPFDEGLYNTFLHFKLCDNTGKIIDQDRGAGATINARKKRKNTAIEVSDDPIDRLSSES